MNSPQLNQSPTFSELLARQYTHRIGERPLTHPHNQRSALQQTQISKLRQTTSTLPLISTMPTQQQTSSWPKSINYQNLLSAGGFIALGLLLNRIPARASKFNLLSTRIEDWAQMGLGVLAVNNINKGLKWSPTPWQHALETVTVLTFLSKGLNIKQWKNFPLLAIGIPPLVQATHWLTEKAERTLTESNSKIPAGLVKIGIAAVSTVLGIFGLRSVMKAPSYQQLFKQNSSKNASETLASAGITACARCGGAHAVCMEEIGDLMGSMGGGLHKEKAVNK